ncbi:hypothetical protein EOPP23_00835 [Endozoicomonas sp. OPT23]|uniref:DUF4922 domain-containing protein n=1 Tax=Endozoicomonas sp. OPT23 TaxID=2072845 RepID=UPI00129BA81E|nr:DUF4922 domain-containing protein [Endozoicomonas sp. OPT23]MRI31536.1 hypothetical protein [Endozoicomonas sp. OPT23]
MLQAFRSVLWVFIFNIAVVSLEVGAFGSGVEFAGLPQLPIMEPSSDLEGESYFQKAMNRYRQDHYNYWGTQRHTQTDRVEHPYSRGGGRSPLLLSGSVALRSHGHGGAASSTSTASSGSSDGSSGQSAQSGSPSDLKRLAMRAVVKNLATRQEAAQYLLQLIDTREGLPATLKALYMFEEELGYLKAGWSDPQALEWLSFDDPGSDKKYTAVINHVRTEYSKSHLHGKSEPDKTKCVLCAEYNVEQAGHEQKQYLRVYHFDLNGVRYFIQAPPFPYQPLHFVLIEHAHTPMHLDHHSLLSALEFLDRAPEFSLCSNSDIAGAGSTVPAHHHFQILHDFKPAVTRSNVKEGFQQSNGILTVSQMDYPLATIRLESSDREEIARAVAHVIKNWKQRNEPRYTVNFVARKENDDYRVWVMFRDLSLKPPESFRKVKPENMGFIEAAGHLLLSTPADATIEETLANNHYMVELIEEALSSISPDAFIDEAIFWELVTLYFVRGL